MLSARKQYGKSNEKAKFSSKDNSPLRQINVSGNFPDSGSKKHAHKDSSVNSSNLVAEFVSESPCKLKDTLVEHKYNLENFSNDINVVTPEKPLAQCRNVGAPVLNAEESNVEPKNMK